MVLARHIFNQKKMLLLCPPIRARGLLNHVYERIHAAAEKEALWWSFRSLQKGRSRQLLSC